MVKGRLVKKGPLVEFAYSETPKAAERWIKSMKSHPSWCDFRVIDRAKKAKKKK